jgi:hypothetical protein
LGVSVSDIVTPVAPLITLLNDTTGAPLPTEPSTIAGNVPDVLETSSLPSDFVNAQDTPVNASCAALGLVTRNENAMTEPALKLPPASVTVNTCDPLMLAVPDAPEDGDVKLSAPLFTLIPAPESAIKMVPFGGIVVFVLTEIDMLTMAALRIALLMRTTAGPVT